MSPYFTCGHYINICVITSVPRCIVIYFCPSNPYVHRGPRRFVMHALCSKLYALDCVGLLKRGKHWNSRSINIPGTFEFVIGTQATVLPIPARRIFLYFNFHVLCADTVRTLYGHCSTRSVIGTTAHNLKCISKPMLSACQRYLTCFWFSNGHPHQLWLTLSPRCSCKQCQRLPSWLRHVEEQAPFWPFYHPELPPLSWTIGKALREEASRWKACIIGILSTWIFNTSPYCLRTTSRLKIDPLAKKVKTNLILNNRWVVALCLSRLLPFPTTLIKPNLTKACISRLASWKDNYMLVAFAGGAHSL